MFGCDSLYLSYSSLYPKSPKRLTVRVIGPSDALALSGPLPQPASSEPARIAPTPISRVGRRMDATRMETPWFSPGGCWPGGVVRSPGLGAPHGADGCLRARSIAAARG